MLQPSHMLRPLPASLLLALACANPAPLAPCPWNAPGVTSPPAPARPREPVPAAPALDPGCEVAIRTRVTPLGGGRYEFVAHAANETDHPWREATLEHSPPLLAPPYDALLVTDPELAAAGIYPALDRGRTRSTATLSPEHARIADAVRHSETEAVRRFFAQWFGVYQHRSGKAGEYWSLEATLAGFRERLSLTESEN